MSKQNDDKVFNISDPIRTAPKWKFWDKSYHIIVSCNNEGCDYTKKISSRYSSAIVGWGSLMMHKLDLALHASECEFAKKPEKKKTTKKIAKKPAKKAVKKK